MHTDSYFAIGKTHTVCQDYARHSRGTGPAYAIVSDGCSSSEDSDFGARLLTLVCEYWIAFHGDGLQDQSPWLIRKCKDLLAGMLPLHCLDATLLLAHEREDGLVQVVVWGDGVVFAVGHDGTTEVWEIGQDNMPSYLSYLLDPPTCREYLAAGHGKRTIKKWVDGEQDLETADTMPDMQIDASRTFRVTDMAYTLVLAPGAYKMIGVATDGLGSFRHMERNTPVPLSEIVRHVTDVKVPVGKFIERSSRFFLDKTCPKSGWRHDDDYGVAALWTGEVPK